MVGVPAVSMSLIGLLSYVVLWSPSVDFGLEALFKVDLGILAVLWGAIFAFRVDRQLAIPYSIFSYLVYLTTRHLPINILLGVQVVGWTLQITGHYFYEKKFPSWINIFSHLFIGPMWIFSKMIGYYKV